MKPFEEIVSFIANAAGAERLNAFRPTKAAQQRVELLVAKLKDGTIHLGLLVTETPGSVILRQAGGAEQILKRTDIAEVKTLSTSLMPAGLEALITEQDCADLLSAIAGK
jgi:putative heme-binding domain-containing protein